MEWDRREERGLTEDALMLRAEKKNEFKRVAVMREIKWKQKTKVKWLKEGNNTKFFHIMAKCQKNINTISRLKWMPGWCCVGGKRRDRITCDGLL